MSIPTLDGVSAPQYVDQGIPYDNGNVAVDLSSAINHHHQGLPFTAAGRLAVTQDAPDYYGSGAAPFNAGRLCMLDANIDHYASGIPYVAASNIATIGLDPNGVVITQQPTSWFGVETATTDTFLTIASSGDASAMTFVWEELIVATWTPVVIGARPSGSTGSIVASATQSEYVVTNVQFGDNAQQFRCTVTNDTNSRTSVIVTLNVTGGTFFIVTENGDQVITAVGASEPIVTEESE
jgi:hypothetical protein